MLLVAQLVAKGYRRTVMTRDGEHWLRSTIFQVR
jgi:hypothetical protein